jgi:hypothetical protein
MKSCFASASNVNIVSPSFRTPIGRARAWLRLALMQKKMADYFRTLVDQVSMSLAFLNMLLKAVSK